MIAITKDPHTTADSVVRLSYKAWPFSGGEVGVKLDASNHRYLSTFTEYATLVARLTSPSDVMELIMVVDALRRLDPRTPLRLVLPYLPYSRQDRACVAGESFSLKAFASIINGLSFESVTTFDAHSTVAAGVFDRFTEISQLTVIDQFRALSVRIMDGVTFVSPDAGANKKTADLAKHYGHRSFIRADKLRDLNTGAILETVVYVDDLTGYDAVIVDDLCDKGGTFILLAKALKAKGARKVILYVTHGLFSHEKGTQVLYEGGIDEIYTTSSFYSVFPANVSSEIKVLDLETTFKL